jgi:hypothetical protein
MELVCSEWHWSSCEEFGGGVSCEIGFVQGNGTSLLCCLLFLCHFVLIGVLWGVKV